MNRLHHCASGDEIGQVATLDFPDGGRKITIDNLDYHQNVHHMTEQHQNVDKQLCHGYGNREQSHRK